MERFFSEYPYLSVKVKVASQKSDEEHFHLAVRGNLAHIEAASALAAEFAKTQLLAALQANRLGDIVGNNAPQFRIRPLWLDSIEGITASTVIDLGFNMLVVAYAERLHPLAQEVRKAGLKLAVCCSSIEECKGLQGVCDAIVWQQGNIVYSGPKKDPTSLEQAEYELQLLQQECQLAVFYYAQPKCPFLLKLVGLATILFDAYPDLPVYTELSRLPVEAQTRLLPMLTLSQIAIGEGQIFSDFPMAAIENVLGRQRGERFIGAGVRTRMYAAQIIPLWVVGQRLWRAQCVNSIFESWLDRYHPEWSKWLTPELLHHIHTLFVYKEREQVEKAASTLVQLAEALSQYKTALRFQKATKSLEELSELLFYLQQGFKSHFEEICAKTMRKTPLSLQNFTPIAFLALQKSVPSVK